MGTRWKVWLVLLAVVLFPVTAMAQTSKVHVIALDSDDASEDQADALTAALRTKVRSNGGFQLSESNQSLSTLLPALKCPSRPDSACLQRIGDQLKTDRFFWGSVVKAAMPHQVVAEVHLWTRGKPEQVAKETFSDNLKDQNDEALKRIAGGLFDRLTGQQTQGIVIVHANGSQTGTVVVDGKPAGQLDHGLATLQLPSGNHSVDIQVDKMTTTPQDVNVVVNGQSELTFTLAAVTAPPVEASKPSHTKRLIGFVTLGVAAATAIGAGVMGGLYAGDSGTWNGYASGIPNTQTKLCTNPPAQSSPYWQVGSTNNTTACSARSAAQTEGSVAWALGGAAVGLAVVGVILVMTDKSDKEGSQPAAKVRVIPSFGPGGGGVSALVTF